MKELMSKPNPLTYNSNYSTFNNGGITIGHEKRKGLENSSVSPGPGAYEPKKPHGDRIYSIPKSQSTSKLKDGPGPGSYDPKVFYNSQYQAIGINKDKRKPFYDEKQGVPGPGQYTFHDGTNPKGGYTIPHEKRGDNKTTDSPGPGVYNLPSTVSNLPSYVAAKHK